MNWNSLGSAAHTHMMQQEGLRQRQELQRLTSEMASGRHADLGRATGGDFTALADIARALDLNTAFSRSIAEAGLLANARQTALARIETETEGLASRIIAFSTNGSMQDMALALSHAPERLEHVVNALNTRVAGVSLFAGNAPDRPALISGPAMLAELRPLVAAAPTADDAIAAIEQWFLAPGGGFETVAWQGGSGPAGPAILGEGLETRAAVSALDPALRELLAGLALTAIAAETSGPGTNADRAKLVTAAVSRISRGDEALIRLRSDLGAGQARIEEARVTIETTRAGLELEQGRLTEADPYRTATDLQALQTRLETLYVLTARLSRLTLTEFLR